MTLLHLRQTEASECGLVCLAIAADMLGSHLDLPGLRRRFPVSSRGLTLKDITNIASTMNMVTRPVSCELDELPQLKCPSILHWNLNHFVVLESVSRGRLVIRDPAQGRLVVSREFASKAFTGVAIEVSMSPAFKKREERSRLEIFSLFQATPALFGGLSQALILSLVLQAYVIASPFYMKLAIDEGALKGDRDLLVALAVGFGLFALFNAGAEALRGLALQRVASLLAWDMTQRLFHHMLRLPLMWFQRRRLADVLTRFDSLNPIKGLVAGGLVGVIIDGILSVVTIIMMLIFAPSLTVVVLAGLSISFALQISTISWSMKLGAASLTASIIEQGKRIETLRAMQTIKVMAAEAEREADWGNKLADTIRTSQASEISQIAISGLRSAIEAISLVVVVYIGIDSIIAGSMSIGLLYAFLSYRSQFTRAAQGVLEQLINTRMLRLHTDRLADIALHPVEKGLDKFSTGYPPVQGSIEIRNVFFSYAPHEQPILKGINLSISTGEFVAIVGPSGTGKSTLLKIIGGLYAVNAGEIILDGRSLDSWGPRVVRENLGAVMQDDELLSGSIAENVSFFAEAIDMERVWLCLKAAALDAEVSAMPMGSETMVGDMGASLSGGQKQRVLLARALYRKPKILILDEATSHLDLGRERAINAALQELSITRIIVAHRPETIAAADRVIRLENGRIVGELRRKERAEMEGVR